MDRKDTEITFDSIETIMANCGIAEVGNYLNRQAESWQERLLRL